MKRVMVNSMPKMNANAPELWDRIWSDPTEPEWRERALEPVYSRIEFLLRCLPLGSQGTHHVEDLGGGVGTFARRLLASEACKSACVVDASPAAIRMVNGLDIPGLGGVCADLSVASWPDGATTVITCTECLEHLDEHARQRVLQYAARVGKAFISVPNDRLGPDEEAQHTIKFTALTFLKTLRGHFGAACRVEVIGGFLLGVCGIAKPYRLSVTMPVRDEEHDLERTLASFRGVADEIVVGIDPRSVDGTRAIAEKYAEVVFTLDAPTGPEEAGVPEAGVHFAHIRNQCMNNCLGDWIFMTEGHEYLAEGQDVLLALDKIMPEAARVGFVLRQGNGQQWAFPWLCRNAPDLRYKRSTHNILDYPNKTFVVQFPQVRTMHERHADVTKRRADQRKSQNRKTLLDDWMRNGNQQSLYYLGSEWRDLDDRRAMERLENLISLPAHNGAMHYQARLILAKMYSTRERYAEARDVLIVAGKDDWGRIEHWIWLGDLAFMRQAYEEALQFYRYAGTRCGEAPFTLWWVDLAMYSYLPAQRLAMVYGELGKYEEALLWAKRVKDQLPADATEEAVAEVNMNISIIEEAIHASST